MRMIFLRGTTLEKGGGNMSSEYWQEQELSLRMMFGMNSAHLGLMKMTIWRLGMTGKPGSLKMNFTNK